MASRIRTSIGVTLSGIFILGGWLLSSISPAQAALFPVDPRYIVTCDPALLSLTACEKAVHDRGGIVIKSLPLIHAVAMTLSSKGALEPLYRSEGILRVEADTVYKTLGEVAPANIRRSQADMLWEMGITGKAVAVAVLDTGIEKSHPDLLSGLAGGYDAVRQSDWNDENGHGTHVAGIIAAGRNGRGVVGIAPGVSLYAVKVLQSSGAGYASDIIDGISWCIVSGCRVMNMSFGSPVYNRALEAAIGKAAASGILIVAAAGVEESAGPLYPAAYDHVVAVSAVDDSDEIVPGSRIGSDVDFTAPGLAVYSTYKDKSYASLSGTSMAAAYIAGMAALRMEQYRLAGLPVTSDQIVRDLVRSSKDLGTPGWDAVYGYGLPDGARFLQIPVK